LLGGLAWFLFVDWLLCFRVPVLSFLFAGGHWALDFGLRHQCVGLALAYILQWLLQWLLLVFHIGAAQVGSWWAQAQGSRRA